MTAIETIIREVCETDPADPDNCNSVCIKVDDLRLILESCIGPDVAPTRTQGADDAPDCTCNIAIGPNDTWPVPHNEACPVTHWARDQFRKSGENAQGADDAELACDECGLTMGESRLLASIKSGADDAQPVATVREQFEAWLSQKGRFPKDVERSGEGIQRGKRDSLVSQARDEEYRALLGLQSSVEESVRNGLMDVSVEQSLATVQATQSAPPEAAPK